MYRRREEVTNTEKFSDIEGQSAVSTDPGNVAFLAKLTEVQFWAHKDYILCDYCCRLCDYESTAEINFSKFGGQTWAFWSGIRHFYEHHGLNPSPEFRAYVMGFQRPTTKQFLDYLEKGSTETIGIVKRAAEYPKDIQVAIKKVDWEKWYDRLIAKTVLDLSTGTAGLVYSK